MATMTTELVIKLISCELCGNICGRGVCLPCCSVQACRGCATKKVRGVYSARLIFFLGCKRYTRRGGKWKNIFSTPYFIHFLPLPQINFSLFPPKMRKKVSELIIFSHCYPFSHIFYFSDVSTNT